MRGESLSKDVDPGLPVSSGERDAAGGAIAV